MLFKHETGFVRPLLRDLSYFLQQAEAAGNAQQNEAFEIDQWILDFANLFREQLNIEPDKHLDLTNMGWDKLQAALDSAVRSDKAPAIFDAAADKFQEVSAHGEAPDKTLDQLVVTLCVLPN